MDKKTWNQMFSIIFDTNYVLKSLFYLSILVLSSLFSYPRRIKTIFRVIRLNKKRQAKKGADKFGTGCKPEVKALAKEIREIQTREFEL